MSEGVFLDPRNANNNALKSAVTAAFGNGAAVSITQKAGCLYQFSVLNKSSTAYYLQLHDLATAPAANAAPIFEVPLPAGPINGVQISFQLAGLYFANGIAIAISTTPLVLTFGSSNDAVAYTRHTTAG